LSRFSDIIRQHNMTSVQTLQESAYKRVELLKDSTGQKAVLKYCKQACPTLKLETQVLQIVSAQSYEYLEFPKYIDSATDFIMMSFIERENHSRETILQRPWAKADIDTLHNGLEEFKTLDIPKSAYSIKQRVMGSCYPSIKALLIMPALLQRRLLNFIQILKLLGLALRYALIRPGIRQVTTHYDMTTLNCAFAANKKLSILDLELGYALGDPYFDMCYFLTIPPQAIDEWEFQKSVLKKALSLKPSSTEQFRFRFLFLLCVLVRLRHFPDGTWEQDNYRRSSELLLHPRKFKQWFETLDIIPS